MPAPTAHFQPDDRNIVIVEDCRDIRDAEKAADQFLEGETSCDEAGSHYQRVQVSGVQREGKYFFDVVVVH
ncbi:MAG: hypothetical protein JST42_29785 [Bacteroidetes bacterium]|nr:hypothetical protein [Bacteroidota bacterium]